MWECRSASDILTLVCPGGALSAVQPDQNMTQHLSTETQAHTHILHVARSPVLPAEVNEGIIGLLDVNKAFSLVWSYSAAFQGHLPCPKFHQVFAGGATGAWHQARK